MCLQESHYSGFICCGIGVQREEIEELRLEVRFPTPHSLGSKQWKKWSKTQVALWALINPQRWELVYKARLANTDETQGPSRAFYLYFVWDSGSVGWVVLGAGPTCRQVHLTTQSSGKQRVLQGSKAWGLKVVEVSPLTIDSPDSKRHKRRIAMIGQASRELRKS